MWQFLKAQLSAQVSTLADFALTLVLSYLCGMYYVCATCLGAVFGGVVNCSINYRWVFGGSHRGKVSVAFRYLWVWLVSIALNTCGVWLLTDYLHITFILSKVLVAVIVAVCWNYLMQKYYVYK